MYVRTFVLRMNQIYVLYVSAMNLSILSVRKYVNVRRAFEYLFYVNMYASSVL